MKVIISQAHIAHANRGSNVFWDINLGKESKKNPHQEVGKGMETSQFMC